MAGRSEFESPSGVPRPVDSWVVVHNLQSHDGGILDPDDRLNDVVDDREQIVASYEDGEGMHHGGGDGASGSSVGTSSPDIFQLANALVVLSPTAEDGEIENDHKYQPLSRTDIEVTGEQIASGLITAPLQVRRGSEPALNQLVVGSGTTAGRTDARGGGKTAPHQPAPADPSKRWSATPIIVDELDESKEKHTRGKDGSKNHFGNGHLSPNWTFQEKEEEERSAFKRFVRDGSSRLSMQFLGERASGLHWAEAADRLNKEQSKSLPREHRRKEPLGQANSSSNLMNHVHLVQDSDIEEELNSNNLEYVVMRNDQEPLGIHVVPDYDRLGKDRGILVQGIEPGGKIDRDGRLAIYDRIIEINGKNLLNMPFHRVQEIFKDSLRSSELQLRVIKHRSAAGNFSKKPPAPVFPRSAHHRPEDKENVNMVEGEERLVSLSTKVATVSPTKKVSPVHPPARAASSLLSANTRKIGRKIELELAKGPHGLGFSITTRDNPAGGNCPIYIKNILPKGAALEDGRLRPGDRLLEVNGVEMTGKTQAEAVSVLRNAPPGSKVRIVVSRQEESTSPKLPRPIQGVHEHQRTATTDLLYKPTNLSELPGNTPYEPADQYHDDGLVFPWKHREILTFDIPVHDTEKAGLGVSVKGKTTASHNSSNNSAGSSIDLGIFVKSVLHGGAASRDGRLKTNDQLLNVNGISLLRQSNSDAMETLRKAMLQTEGPIPGVISLTIARRVSSPGPGGLSNGHLQDKSGRDSASSILSGSSGTETFGEGKADNDTTGHDNSGTSENSDNTVIFLGKNEDSFNSSNLSGKSITRITSENTRHPETRNPVIDRLTGQNANQNSLRNESYFRATRDTWNTTQPINNLSGNKLSSPTVNLPSGEMVLIEEEYVPHPMLSHAHRSNKPVDLPRQRNVEGEVGPTNPPPSEQSSGSHVGDATYTSQLSLEEAADGFSRDAFGRQSMSEKRHATLDAKNTDTYQRNKKLREERDRQRHMHFQHLKQNQNKMGIESKSGEARSPKDLVAMGLARANSIESVVSISRSQADSDRSELRIKNEFGPSLGMKKSSSLESLQTMVQEIQMQEDSDVAYSYRNAQGGVRAVRGRGCNESFRAAVDRSYEAPLAELRSRLEMETLAEEEGAIDTGMDNGDGFGPVRGCPRQSSLNAVLDGKTKGGKKKPGLFRGIGSMFRFGKHRKTLDVPLQMALRAEQEEGVDGFCEEREAARRAAQDEQQRIQEQYRRLMQQQRQLENNQSFEKHQDHLGRPELPPSHPGGPPHHHHLYGHPQPHHHHHEGSNSSGASSGGGGGGGGGGAQSRSERIHQLRAQHQQRHAERRGQYPLDDREEKYEEVIRQRLEQPDYSHVRAASYDLYGEMTRPGSRVGITDPNKFSHYVNYEEIQQHLNCWVLRYRHVSSAFARLSTYTSVLSSLVLTDSSQLTYDGFEKLPDQIIRRQQQHYHSQRRDNRDPQQRPVSNFYEYESIQAVMRANQQRAGSVPSTTVTTTDNNSNSLPRRTQHESRSNGQPMYQQHHQRIFQSTTTTKTNVVYPPSNHGGSSNTNSSSSSANHHRGAHSHDMGPVTTVHSNTNYGNRGSSRGGGARTRGPFVTHVTIGQQAPPPPGSKV
uniref:PDZ domain-containing protein n=1 Tax=Timema genevievae TaxID=629358 RepID=A0A7R9JU31_TIMGE|nr:unnamed protein product [Timema genevievae]